MGNRGGFGKKPCCRPCTCSCQARYTWGVETPFDRQALGERNRLDLIEEIDEARRHTPAERVRMALDLARLCYRLGRAGFVETPPEVERRQLEEKARIYARPLTLLAR